MSHRQNQLEWKNCRDTDRSRLLCRPPFSLENQHTTEPRCSVVCVYAARLCAGRLGGVEGHPWLSNIWPVSLYSKPKSWWTNYGRMIDFSFHKNTDKYSGLFSIDKQFLFWGSVDAIVINKPLVTIKPCSFFIDRSASLPYFSLIVMKYV